MHVTFDFYWLL